MDLDLSLFYVFFCFEVPGQVCQLVERDADAESQPPSSYLRSLHCGRWERVFVARTGGLFGGNVVHGSLTRMGLGIGCWGFGLTQDWRGSCRLPTVNYSGPQPGRVTVGAKHLLLFGGTTSHENGGCKAGSVLNHSANASPLHLRAFTHAA